MNQIIIGSPDQFGILLRTNTPLLQLPSLASLAPVIANPPTGCACRNQGTWKGYREKLQAVMYGLSNDSWLAIKGVLKADRICYYLKVDGKLKLTCV